MKVKCDHFGHPARLVLNNVVVAETGNRLDGVHVVCGPCRGTNVQEEPTYVQPPPSKPSKDWVSVGSDSIKLMA